MSKRFAEAHGDRPRQGLCQDGIRIERQMRPMLFHRTDRQQQHRTLAQSRYLLEREATDQTTVHQLIP